MDINYRDMVPFYHKQGGDACGGIAFYINTLAVVEGSLIFAADVELDDGSSPDVHSIPVCEKCGTGVWMRVDGIIKD